MIVTTSKRILPKTTSETCQRVIKYSNLGDYHSMRYHKCILAKICKLSF